MFQNNNVPSELTLVHIPHPPSAKERRRRGVDSDPFHDRAGQQSAHPGEPALPPPRLLGVAAGPALHRHPHCQRLPQNRVSQVAERELVNSNIIHGIYDSIPPLRKISFFLNYAYICCPNTSFFLFFIPLRPSSIYLFYLLPVLKLYTYHSIVPLF